MVLTLTPLATGGHPAKSSMASRSRAKTSEFDGSRDAKTTAPDSADVRDREDARLDELGYIGTYLFASTSSM